MTTAYSGDGITFPDNTVQATAPKVGMVNRIINGNFDVWQRGTSFTSTSVNEYSADRFRTEGNSLSTTISRQAFTAGQTEVPDFPTYFCRVVTSTIASGQYWAFQQRLEMPQVLNYGQTVTLSYWVRATTGTLAAGAFDFGLDGDRDSSPALTTTWQKITGTYTSGLSGERDSLYLVYLGANKPAISVDIAQVQLEKGSTATDFEYVDYGRQLQQCQRYFEMSFSQGTTPADGVNNGNAGATAVCYSSSDARVNTKFSVTKRAAPTLVTYRGGNGGTNGQWSYYDGSSWVTFGASSVQASQTQYYNDVAPSGRAFGQALIVDGNWTASAEL